MHSVLVNGFSYFREFVRTASAALKDMPSMLYSLKVIEKKLQSIWIAIRQ